MDPVCTKRYPHVVGLSEPGETNALFVETLDELRALSKALVLGKFRSTDSDAVWGSPFLADVQDRLLQALAGAEPSGGWASWSSADDKEWVVNWVEAEVREVGAWWDQASLDERRRHLAVLFAPFKPSGDLLARLVANQE